MSDLFGQNEYAMTPLERKRMKRRAQEVARGYATTPGTGPAGETCGSCRHLDCVQFAKKYYKCGLLRRLWTGSRRTDVLVGSPACAKWEP